MVVKRLVNLPHRTGPIGLKGHSGLSGGLTCAASVFLLLFQHLYNLVHLDLSYNKLSSLEGVHTKLGNVKTLNLAGNFLESLSGLHKLYSLVNLDLRDNRIEQVNPSPETLGDLRLLGLVCYLKKRKPMGFCSLKRNHQVCSLLLSC